MPVGANSAKSLAEYSHSVAVSLLTDCAALVLANRCRWALPKDVVGWHASRRCWVVQIETDKVTIDRLPQQGDVEAERVPGKLILTPTLTNADQKTRLKVFCKPPKSAAAGEVKYCKVRKKGKKYIVTSPGPYPMKVRTVLFAPGTAKFKPFREVRKFKITGGRK